MPTLQSELTTLREISASDVHTLFTLFSDPAVTTHMAPPPPTIAKFAGFVEWSHQQRAQGRGFCFGIVPDQITTAVGIMQVRLDPSSSAAEWGFVLSAHFWSTGMFCDAANLLIEFAFETMGIEHLEARIALRNLRGHTAVRKLGARLEATIESKSPQGIPRDPETVWILGEGDWRNRAPHLQASPRDAAKLINAAIAAAESEIRQGGAPERVEPYPLFLFDRRRRE